MAMRMLVDARHPEETRVAVVKGNRIEEFDFESAQKAQIKGNIYLAKVTRVEPSLQAAFIEYGGNRHGFLAFSEIHPDYYQIPKADREALLAEERAAAEEHHAEIEAEKAAREGAAEDHDEDHEDEDEVGGDHDHVDSAANDALRKKRQNLRKRYKIQEVIKRRQVLLVQVVKEERGNKGAALTTYLSLAGRYCVFMPNTNHGGGISRKIANGGDRKRLKKVVSELDVPTGMGVIVRTAGASRTKTEIKRDFDYLTRLWNEVREATLAAQAPTLIHEDSDLVKRAIRDLYNRDIDEVLVDGEEGYKDARGFMKLLMPSHARKVKQYADPVPLFQRYRVEEQLAEMYQPVVQLKSGGYLVINPTEALVAIDINSGRSTKEHNIEETALKTNLEAARESARQLKLRDMAGLIVIDFIDMDIGNHARKVEKALKEALKDDRARIQVGRISQFGLLEMSRQRLRTGVLEASTHTCPVCDGAGIVRTVESAALGAIRTVEAEALKGKHSEFKLHLPQNVAVFLLNEKRAEVSALEERYGITVLICPEPDMVAGDSELETKGPPPQPNVDISKPDSLDETEEDVAEAEIGEDESDEEADRDAREHDSRSRGKRRRGRGRRGRGRDQDADEEAAESSAKDTERGDEESEERPKRRRRRGRRGGRRRGQEGKSEEGTTAHGDAVEEKGSTSSTDKHSAEQPAGSATSAKQAGDAKPKPEPRRKSAKANGKDGAVADKDVAAAEDSGAKPKRARRKRKSAPNEAANGGANASGQPSQQKTVTAPANDSGPKSDISGDEGPKRKGWWQRTFGP